VPCLAACEDQTNEISISQSVLPNRYTFTVCLLAGTCATLAGPDLQCVSLALLTVRTRPMRNPYSKVCYVVIVLQYVILERGQ
jgi:hypothetical protein